MSVAVDVKKLQEDDKNPGLEFRVNVPRRDGKGYDMVYNDIVYVTNEMYDAIMKADK